VKKAKQTERRRLNVKTPDLRITALMKAEKGRGGNRKVSPASSNPNKYVSHMAKGSAEGKVRFPSAREETHFPLAFLTTAQNDQSLPRRDRKSLAPGIIAAAENGP